MRPLKSIFMRKVIGWVVLKPWIGKKFASGKMAPRYDQNGNIYMLLCVDDDA